MELGIKNALTKNTNTPKHNTQNGNRYVGNATVLRNVKIKFVTEPLLTTYSRHQSTLTFQPKPVTSNIPQLMPPKRQHRRLKRKHHTNILTQYWKRNCHRMHNSDTRGTQF